MIDREEFKKVMTWMRDQNRFGRSHSGGRRTGLHVSEDVENAGLVELFFGTDGKRQLPMEQFEFFMKELHTEVSMVCTMLTVVSIFTKNLENSTLA